MGYRFALVLGGGGARGFAHVGVILELVRAGIEPDLVLGTSMGAIVGGFYAAGQDLERLVRVLEVLDLNRLFGITPSYRRLLERVVVQSILGHIHGHYPTDEERRVLTQFREFLRLFCKGKRFEELDLAFGVIAADIMTGEQVIIREGPLHEGILASAALPGVLPPVSLDGRLLVDGGAVNNLPVDVAAEWGAEVVLGVLVRSRTRPELRTPADVILQTYNVTSQELLHTKVARARERLGERLLIVHPEVSGIGALEFGRIAEAVDAGRTAMAPLIERLRALL